MLRLTAQIEAMDVARTNTTHRVYCLTDAVDFKIASCEQKVMEKVQEYMVQAKRTLSKQTISGQVQEKMTSGQKERKDDVVNERIERLESQIQVRCLNCFLNLKINYPFF